MSITFQTTHTHGPELNMANGNAAAILQLLGLPADPGGEATAEQMLGRILIAQALLDVATDDENGTPDVHDGRVIYCGRRPGYLAERLADLQEIATWAHQHHVPVVWG